jgi:hypothetical protein
MAFTIIDHQVVDADTGEVLGPVVEAGSIANQNALESVLDVLGQQEAKVKAEELRLQAIIENARRTLSRKQSYLGYLRSIYNAPIEVYAKSQLEGKKTKSIVTPYGTVAFRTTKGGLKVANNDLAASYAIGSGLSHAVKLTYNFQISKLTDEQRHSIANDPFLPEGFELVPDKETMSIKTGVE